MYGSICYTHTAVNLSTPPALGWEPASLSSTNVSATPALVVSRVKQASRWRQTLREDPEQGITDVTNLQPGRKVAHAFRHSICRPVTEKIVSNTGVATSLAIAGCIAIRTFSIQTAGAGASLMGERRGRARRLTGGQSWDIKTNEGDRNVNVTGFDLMRLRRRAVKSNRTCLSFMLHPGGGVKVVVSLGCSPLYYGVHNEAADLFAPVCSGRGNDQCQDEDAIMTAGSYATTTWLNFPLLLRAAVQEQRFAIGSPLRSRYRVVEGVRLPFHSPRCLPEADGQPQKDDVFCPRPD